MVNRFSYGNAAKAPIYLQPVACSQWLFEAFPQSCSTLVMKVDFSNNQSRKRAMAHCKYMM
jgi:hypothetical protein